MAAAARPSNGWCLYSPPFKASLPSPHEGWVVGSVEQGGALRGSEGYRRWPVHVSSAGKLQHNLLLVQVSSPDFLKSLQAACSPIFASLIWRVLEGLGAVVKVIRSWVSSSLSIFMEEDDLRMAVKEIICDSETGRQEYEEAVIAITVEQSLKRYCQRIRRPDFWGGESEFLVLSRLCRQPIIIYIPEREYHGRGNGFIPIAEYGLEFTKNTKQWKKKTPVRLLYSGRNHYDLLV
ncbi:Cysteine proteinases superfamily protein [Zea mays]|uniref:Ubiquitin thioesterase OTU n=1 Tax=Zea mays TaxID=4577 RepID=A0A1D6JXE3_MAIZE|nr:Cysteine proteinases superfamily protein [Zea mays]